MASDEFFDCDEDAFGLEEPDLLGLPPPGMLL